MKKIVMMLTMPIFWAMATCIMAGCGSKTGKAVSDTDSLAVDSINGSVVDKHSEAYIRQRIDTIYKFVGKITYDADGNRDYNYSPFGDLVGDCSISHSLASKGYDGPIRLRKGYFYYRGVR